MNLFSKVILTTAFIGTATFTVANPVVNQSALAPALTSVKHALTLKDDAKVQLRGNVVKALGDEKYQFRDSTGTVTVDIDDELWRGKPVAVNTAVTLIGKVDIDYNYTPMKTIEIDVKDVKF